MAIHKWYCFERGVRVVPPNKWATSNSNFSCMFLNLNILSNFNFNCSYFLDLRNLQEQVKKAFCYQKLFWPFTVWINCSSDLKNFENSRPSASNFKSFSRSLEQFFLTVGQNNFGNKIPFLLIFQTNWQWEGKEKLLRLISMLHLVGEPSEASRVLLNWFTAPKNLNLR